MSVERPLLYPTTPRPGNRSGDRSIPDFTAVTYRNAIDEIQTVKIAARYVKDALHGLKPEIVDTHHQIWERVSFVHRNLFYEIFLRLIILFFCCLILFDDAWSTFIWSLTEILCCTLFLIDVVLGCFDYGIKRYIENKWLLVYALLSLMTFIHGAISLITNSKLQINWFPAFRPIIFLCRDRSLHGITTTMLKTVPRILDTLGVVGVLIILYASLGIALFRGNYTDKYQNFDNIWNASLAMTTLLTTENYPDILYPGLAVKPIVASFFFVSYIMIGVWVYWSLILAVIFEYYKHCHEEVVLQKRINIQQALLMAFSLISSGENTADETIDFKIFQELLRKVDSSLSDDKHRVMFLLLDENSNGDIDAEEFLKLCDVLHYHITTVYERSISVDSCVTILRRIKDTFLYPHPRIKNIVESKWFIWSVRLVLLVNVGVICAWNDSMSDKTALSLDIINQICLGAFGIEILLKISALGFFEFVLKKRNLFDLFIISINLLAEIFAPDSIYVLEVPNRIAAMQIFRSLLIMRIITIFPRFITVVVALISGLSTMLRLLGLLLVIFYVYAVIGMSVFGNYIRTDMGIVTWAENFSSFPKAMCALFQISTTNNWNDVMYSTMINTGSSLYFVSFYFIIVVVILNVLTSVIIDTYSDYKKKVENCDDDQIIYLRIYHSETQTPVFLRNDRYKNPIKGHVSGSIIIQDDRDIIRRDDGSSTLYRVERTYDWYSNVIKDRIPELRNQEIVGLRNSILKLQKALEEAVSSVKL